MSAAPIEEYEDLDPRDLDPAALLEVAAANEHELRKREALRLRLAYQWAVLYPATAQTGVATHGGPALGVLMKDESLGGDGTPGVAAFTPETFALNLGLSPAAGAQLIGDALDLHHRLPLLNKRVRKLQVPVWQARRVAQQTHHLRFAAARWVDQRLACRADGGCGPVIVDRLVAEATATFDPEDHEAREDQDTAGWDLTLATPAPTEFTGTSDLHATGDTLVLTDFHTLVGEIAHQLLLDGDTSPLGVRKIKAIRIITTAARGHTTPNQTTARTGHTGHTRLYVHLDAHDLDLDLDAGGQTAFAAGRIEKLGAATIAKLRHWVGHTQVTIVPVLNMARRDAVDSHDPPPWMAELVRLRDGHCIFPRCHIEARNCDLDHQIPYTPIQEGGPPGQTHPDNLACLCRRHHRAKTANLWRYTRTPEDHYLWHGPHSATYLVTDGGTHRL